MVRRVIWLLLPAAEESGSRAEGAGFCSGMLERSVPEHLGCPVFLVAVQEQGRAETAWKDEAITGLSAPATFPYSACPLSPASHQYLNGECGPGLCIISEGSHTSHGFEAW